MKALMRVCFGLVLAIGLTAGLGCSQNTGKCCGQCKSGKKACSADCKKPCCAKGAGKCPADCKKPCCANKCAKCPANCDKPCCKDKKKCPANCQKACCKDSKKCTGNCAKDGKAPCCMDNKKASTGKSSTGTGTMTPKTMGN